MPRPIEPQLADTMQRLLDDHSAAVREFLADAASTPVGRWNVPRAPGKWTPAQETKHLALGYAGFNRDLRGEGAMRLRGRWWQRQLWRWRFLTRILAEHRMPVPARAPRESRPPDAPGDQATVIADLRDETQRFDAIVRNTLRSAPRRRVTHPYFGGLSLEQLLGFCAAHTRHHAAFVRTSHATGGQGNANTQGAPPAGDPPLETRQPATLEGR